MTEAEFNEKWEAARPTVLSSIDDMIAKFESYRGDSAYQKRVSIRQQMLDVAAFTGIPTYTDDLPRGIEDYTAEEIARYFFRAMRYGACDRPAVAAVVCSTAQPTSFSEGIRLVRINAPSWYLDPEFKIWLNSPDTATWKRPGDEPDEGSDVFFTCHLGEGGSDYPGDDQRPGIPKEIWEHLEFMVAERFGWEAEVLVWVSNTF